MDKNATFINIIVITLTHFCQILSSYVIFNVLLKFVVDTTLHENFKNQMILCVINYYPLSYKSYQKLEVSLKRLIFLTKIRQILEYYNSNHNLFLSCYVNSFQKISNLEILTEFHQKLEKD